MADTGAGGTSMEELKTKVAKAENALERAEAKEALFYEELTALKHSLADIDKAPSDSAGAGGVDNTKEVNARREKLERQIETVYISFNKAQDAVTAATQRLAALEQELREQRQSGGGPSDPSPVMAALAEVNTKLEQLSGLDARFKTFALGFAQQDIVIATVIPQQFRGGSIAASHVGSDQALTAFVRSHVVGPIHEDWRPDLGLTLGIVNTIRTFGDLKSHVEGGSEFGLMDIGNDNQFNVKVNIIDSEGTKTHFKARADALAFANHSQAASKDERVDHKFKHALCFVEIESGEKGMDNAELQLLATLRAASAYLCKTPLYGVVINRTFTQARLLRVFNEASSADGIFHPSQFADVLSQIQRNFGQ